MAPVLAALVRNEGSDTHSQNMATGSDEEIRAAAARSIASKQRNQQGSGKLRSMSFSDSAHSSQQRQSPQPAKLRTGQSLNISRQVVAQYAENMEDTSPCTTSGSFQDEDSAYGPSEMYHVTQDSASSSQALPYPLHSSGVASSLHPVPQQQQGLQSGLGFMEPVAEVNEDGSLHSSHGAEPSQSALEHAPLLQSAPASQHQSQGGPSMKLITTPWANGRQAGWPEVEAVPFVSADDSLKRHWRTIALQV